jgi:GxxExxY protein
MSELLYKEKAFQLVGLCMQVHRELGKAHDEVIFKDAFVVELSRPGIPFLREKNYEITYKGFILPHCYKPFQFVKFVYCPRIHVIRVYDAGAVTDD